MRRKLHIGLILIILPWVALLLATHIFGATITSNGTGGGSFRKSATWNGGTVPGDGDLVVIAAGDSVWFNADTDTNFTIGNDGSDDLDISGKLTCINSGEIDTLFMKGGISVNNGGSFIIDKSSDGADYFIIIIDCSSDGEHGIVVDDGGIMDWDGATKDYATELEGSHAASEDTLIVTSGGNTNWLAGDSLVIEGDIAGETEEIGISSVSGDTCFLTQGLSNQHDDDRKVLNLTRNIKFKSSNSSYDTYIENNQTTKVNFDIQYAEFIDLQAGKGINFNGTSSSGVVRYSSFHNSERGFRIESRDYKNTEITHCIFYLCDYGVRFQNVIGVIVEDNYFFDCTYANFVYQGYALELFFNRNYIADGTVGFRQSSNFVITKEAEDNTFRTNSTADVALVGDCVDDIVFENSIFSSATLLSGTPNTGHVRFNRINENDDDHRSYETYGNVFSSGTGLTYTRVRTASSLAVVMLPNDEDNVLEWEFIAPADSGKFIGVGGYVYTTESNDTEMCAILTGAGCDPDTFTFDSNTHEDSWERFVVSGTPTRKGFCTITFSCFDNSGSNPEFYLDDFALTGTQQNLGDFDNWNKGTVPMVMSTSILAGDIWQSLFSIDYGDGSMGERLKDLIRSTPK